MHVPSLVTRGNFGSEEPYVAADFSLRQEERRNMIGGTGMSRQNSVITLLCHCDTAISLSWFLLLILF